jgi:hypothetical protein
MPPTAPDIKKQCKASLKTTKLQNNKTTKQQNTSKRNAGMMNHVLLRSSVCNPVSALSAIAI